MGCQSIVGHRVPARSGAPLLLLITDVSSWQYDCCAARRSYGREEKRSDGCTGVDTPSAGDGERPRGGAGDGGAPADGATLSAVGGAARPAHGALAAPGGAAGAAGPDGQPVAATPHGLDARTLSGRRQPVAS